MNRQITFGGSLLDRAETLAVLDILEEVQLQTDCGFYHDPVRGLDADLMEANI